MKQTQPIKPTSSESLSKKVVRGGIWVFTLRFTNRSLGFIRTIILARLLAPSDFGLLGIAMLAIATLETFSQTGFQAALIQKKENVESHLDTAWTVCVIRGVILFLILFISAPVIAKFFSSPQATLVIRVIALSILLSGFSNIGILFFQKELEFNKEFVFSLSATLTDLAVSITLAFILRNVWALVWGGLAANLVRLLLSYILHPYRPRIRLEKEKFQDLFGFGKWFLGSSIVIFLATQGDDAFVGKALGVTALGLYKIAFNIGNYPSSEITGMVAKVAFPAYAKLQSAPQQLKEAYLRIVSFSTFLSIPLTGGIIVLAYQFTRIFLGEKWLPIVVPLQILAVSGMFRSIAGTGGAMFHAIGKPRLDFKMNTTRLAVIVLSIYPLTMIWGISGASFSVLLGIVAACYIWLRASTKETNTSARDYVAIILLPLIGTLCMCSVILCILKTTTFINNQLLVFFTSVMAGILVYFGTMFLIEKKSRYGGLKEIKIILNNLYVGSV